MRFHPHLTSPFEGEEFYTKLCGRLSSRNFARLLRPDKSGLAMTGWSCDGICNLLQQFCFLVIMPSGNELPRNSSRKGASLNSPAHAGHRDTS